LKKGSPALLPKTFNAFLGKTSFKKFSPNPFQEPLTHFRLDGMGMLLRCSLMRKQSKNRRIKEKICQEPLFQSFCGDFLERSPHTPKNFEKRIDRSFFFSTLLLTLPCSNEQRRNFPTFIQPKIIFKFLKGVWGKLLVRSFPHINYYNYFTSKTLAAFL